MQISPIPTLSDDINKIRSKTANIVAEQIIPNEKEIYKGGDTAKTIRAEIRETVKSENLFSLFIIRLINMKVLCSRP